jgi:fluoride exporter
LTDQPADEPDRGLTDAPDAIEPRGPGRVPIAVSVALVAAGGVLGALSRYELELRFPAPAGDFPWATFWINVTGAFVLGALLTALDGPFRPLAAVHYVRPLVGTGFIGAYTTWSTFMVETALLAKGGADFVAAGYVVASLSAGLAAAAVGIALISRVHQARPPHLPTRDEADDDKACPA